MTPHNPHLALDPFHYQCGRKSAGSLVANPSHFCAHSQETYNPCRSRYQFFQMSGHSNTKNIFIHCKELGDIVHKVGPFVRILHC